MFRVLRSVRHSGCLSACKPTPVTTGASLVSARAAHCGYAARARRALTVIVVGVGFQRSHEALVQALPPQPTFSPPAELYPYPPPRPRAPAPADPAQTLPPPAPVTPRSQTEPSAPAPPWGEAPESGVGASEEPATGGAEPEAPPSYTAWQGRGPFHPPQPLPPQAGPAPLEEPLEYPRRPVEIFVETGYSLPDCELGFWGLPACTRVGAGAGAALGGLWRATPFFAWGGSLHFYGLDKAERSRVGALAELVGRAYFNENGAVDPYGEMRLGGGLFLAGEREPAHSENVGALSGYAGIGIDFHLGRKLRLGPALGWTQLLFNQRVGLHGEAFVGRLELCGRLTFLFGAGA